MKLKAIILILFCAILSGCDVRVIFDPFGLSAKDDDKTTEQEPKPTAQRQETLKDRLPSYGTSIYTNPNNSMIGPH